MVAKVASGKSINGALSYNENKVAEGKAILLMAINYPKDAEELSFLEKLKRLTNQADLNETIEHKCVHISLNFDPTEHFSPEKYQAIAEAYMEKIGFAEQPYLVYQHTDAAHEHLHIVTTSIKSDGGSIRLHNIGRKISEPARKEIEKEFNLIPAESKSQRELSVLNPVDLIKAVYGKTETKQAISNIVRSVVKYYKFSSLPELNAALNQFNVTADRGEEGTTMHEKGGLVYSLVNQNMEKIGVPIKASSIYDRPILKELQKKFEGNSEKRMPYKSRVCEIVEDVLRQGTDKIGLKNKLAAYGINVLFRQNKEREIYGITYIDNKTYCVFNGSDLGKGYSAKAILERLQTDNGNAEVLSNKRLVEATLQGTDFKKGVRQVLAEWSSKRILVDAKRSEDGTVRYSMGHQDTSCQNFYPLDYKMSTYLQVNDFSQERSAYLQQRLPQLLLINRHEQIPSIIDQCFSIEITCHSLSKELLEEAKRKRRKRY